MEANLQAADSQPVFYFYFDEAKHSLNNSDNKVENGTSDYLALLYMSMASAMGGANNSVAISPNDFKLIHLSLNKNSRYFISGKQTLYNINSGVNPRDIVLFKYERLTTSLFKVTFNADLANGEYCFFYAGNSNRQS